jgi:hypothetical protein
LEIPWARLDNTPKLAISPNGEWIATCTKIGDRYNIEVISKRILGRSRLDQLFEKQLTKVSKVREICFTRNSDKFVAVTEVHHEPPRKVVKIWYFQYTNSGWTSQDRWRCLDDVRPPTPFISHECFIFCGLHRDS